MSEHKPKIPRLVAGLDVKALPLTPIEGFVLSRIDGTASVGDIADLTIQDAGEVQSILGRLERLSAIEWADAGITLPRTSYKPTSTLPRAVVPESGGAASSVRVPGAAPLPRLGAPPQSREGATPANGVPVTGRERGPGSSAPGARRPDAGASGSVRPAAASVRPTVESVPAAPVAPSIEKTTSGVPPPPSSASSPPADGIDIPLERRQRIDELWVALELLGHYEVLGLRRSATKADIRKAYFELSKAFHPDTVFRKSVGQYRTKMEGIFKRLTEAYDVLGKAKARADYDAYLDSIGETREAEDALSGEHEIPPLPDLAGPSATPASSVTSSAAPAPSASSPAPKATPAPEGFARESAPLPTETRPTDEGRRRARELMARKLAGATSAGVTRPAVTASTRPPEPTPPRTRDDLVRDLTGAIRASSTLTGGGDMAARHFLDGKRCAAAGDLTNAVRELRQAMQAAPDRLEYQQLHDQLSRELAVSLASRYLEQAQYEERHGKWAAAALSWSKVCEGRPDDSTAHARAATALLEAKGDLHRAQSFAQRALELRGESGEVRRLLGRIYVAAGLKLNARRELAAAVALDPKDSLAQSLLAQIKD